MKFVHIADMHFDTPFKNLGNSNNLGQLRRIEQRESFKKIINHIKTNEIEYLFISGDLYENQYIRKSTIEYINNLFKEISNTKIFITPGNHDPYIKNSMYESFEWAENVKIFTSKIERIEENEIDIYGVGFNDFYATNLNVENIEIKNKNKINILITHGAINQSEKQQLLYNPLNENKIKEIGFDYVALGHIHKPYYNEEINQRIVYPGSTISMGFDELGKHGFILGDITKEDIKLEFIPIDSKEFKEIKLDISNLKDLDELIEIINNMKIDNNNFYKIILIGNRKFEIDILNLTNNIFNKNILKIKDETEIEFDIENNRNNNTLKGIFINELYEELNNKNITEIEFNKILEIGLSALDNK